MKEVAGRAYKRKSRTTSYCTLVSGRAKLFAGHPDFDLGPPNAVGLNADRRNTFVIIAGAPEGQHRIVTSIIRKKSASQSAR